MALPLLKVLTSSLVVPRTSPSDKVNRILHLDGGKTLKD